MGPGFSNAVARLVPPLRRLRLQRDQLVASNQMLSAENKALSVSNELLLADVHKLRTSIQKLAAKNQELLGALTDGRQRALGINANRVKAAAESRLISTLPRSGTWYTKYLLAFIYRLSGGRDVEIRNVFSYVGDVWRGEVGEEQVSEMRHAGLLSDLPFVEVSHYICPGFLSRGDEVAQSARLILERIGALDYHLDLDRKMFDYSPEAGNHVCFIYRNPLSVFLSYARRFHDRAGVKDKREIPFNPHWPIAVDFQNQPYDNAFAHFVGNFRNSNFMESFMVMAASFAHMKRLYPKSVQIVRYDEIRQGEREQMEKIFEFLGFPVEDDRFQSILNKSIGLVRKEKMSEYEKILGHSLTGATTYYGEEEKTHITRMPERHWKEVLSEVDVAWAREMVEAFYPEILPMLD